MSRRTEYALPPKGKQKRYLQTYNDDPWYLTVAIFDGDRLSKNLEPFFSEFAKLYPTVGYFYVDVPASVVQHYIEGEWLETVGK